MNIFITGLAGMIGFHTANQLVSSGHTVTGVDNFNDYYEVSLKRERERILKDKYNVDVIDDDRLRRGAHERNCGNFRLIQRPVVVGRGAPVDAERGAADGRRAARRAARARARSTPGPSPRPAACP